MLSAVIDLLKQNSFSNITEALGVNVRPSEDFSKFSLNYNQISANPAELLHRECRGLVVRPKSSLSKDDWNSRIVGDVEILACPIPRFFNVGDTNAANINWSDISLQILEKLDGTMCAVYYDNAKETWCVATRSVPEADLKINDSDYTFHSLFMEGFRNTCPYDDFFKFVNKKMTYVFELTSPLNRVVVQYNETRITLLAIRDNETGNEVDIAPYARAYCIPTPKTWNIASIDDLTKYIDEADPIQLEGAVVCDAAFNRIKIKNKTYVMISKSKDLVSSKRNVLKLIISERLDDVIVHFDDTLRSKLQAHQDDFRKFCSRIDSDFATWKSQSETRKEFAQLVMKSGHAFQAYFSLWEGKHTSAASWFSAQHEAARVTRNLLDVVWEQMYGELPPEVEETRE